MSSPTIELRWGRGLDSHSGNAYPYRERLRPVIKSAIDLAKQGLADYNIEFSASKHVEVDLVNPSCTVRASAGVNNTCHLNFMRGEVRRQQLDTAEVATSLFHEFIHLARYEKVRTLSPIELAASEGLAYMSGYDFGNSIGFNMGKTGYYDPVEEVWGLTKRELRHMRQQFIEESALASNLTGERLYTWFDSGTNKHYPRGVLVGICAISACENDGWEIADLIHLQPELIIGT